MSKGSRKGTMAFGGIIAVIGLGFASAIVWTWISRDDLKPGQVIDPRAESGELHPVEIHLPRGVALVNSGKLDSKGQAIMVACGTCHDTRDANFLINSGGNLKQFHQGLSTQHGDLTCLSCHNSKDYDTLKRADGRALGFSASMQLCAQCHGPQVRDYHNGSHGGMQGYWDLSRGGRTRNTCIDCHDPHHPAYPLVLPVFPPILVRGETLPTSHSSSTETPSNKEHE